MRSAPAGTFIDAGGHHMSGGFSLEQENVHTIDAVLEKAFEKALSVAVTKDVLADAELFINDVNPNTWKMIEQCAPFGCDNPKPLFIFRDVPVASFKRFGKTKNHLEITFEKTVPSGGFSNVRGGDVVRSIVFFKTEDDFPNVTFGGGSLQAGKEITFLAHIEKSYFMNRPEIRLRIVDILPTKA